MSAREPVVPRLCVAIAPLLASAAMAWAVTSGPLHLGGGEKDIFLVFPLAVWSLMFMISSVVFWTRGATLARASGMSALLSTVLLAALFALVVMTWH